MLQSTLAIFAGLASVTCAIPFRSRSADVACNPASRDCGPVPGESDSFNNYTGVAAPFPGNLTSPIKPTVPGSPGPDDQLFQNLLSAEWVIFSFYQAAVDTYNESSFTALGLPNTTYERIQQIRDNEAGHLRIFQDSISNTSIKPGACKYSFPFTADAPFGFLGLQQLIEQSSEAFLTGLVQQAKLNATKGALVAIGEIESRHSSWALIDVWNANPFTGPSDTVFPYANQILDSTNQFVVPGSCPPENPQYPNPSQHLPSISFVSNSTDGRPGSNITFTFDREPAYEEGKQYYAVFFHGVQTVTMPFDRCTNSTEIPAAFDTKGLLIAVIADQPDAPTLESVVAGPLFLIEQPAALTLILN